MGSNQSSDTLHCNRYMKGQGPQSVYQQANKDVNGGITASCFSQPVGHMTWEILHKNMPTYPDANTLKVSYDFPEGIQAENHPHPGQPYAASRLVTFLPDNHEGKAVLKLMERAFNQQLLFTISTSQRGEDVITPASLPLKTHQEEEGNAIDGYLDTSYLKTMTKAMRSKGVK